MHCVKCGSALPDDAAFCPGCGTPNAPISGLADVPPPKAATPLVSNAKTGPGCLKIALGVIVGFMVLGVVASMLPKPTPSQVTGSDSSPSASAGTDDLPLAVSAKELFRAYEGNEASAQTYFGKRKLLVSGTVDKVTLDILDNPEILLRTPNQFMSAHAALADDSKSQAGQFNPGDSVKLLCDDVSEVASIPMLKDCRPAPKDQKSQPIQWSKK